MKILLAGFYDEQIQKMQNMFPDVDFVRTKDVDIDSANADALIGVTRDSFDSVFTEQFLVRNKSIRWAHAPGAGIDFYLFPNLEKSPIVMTNGKIIQGPEVAEHAVALLLCLTRRISFAMKGLAKEKIPAPIELRGKTAVVIGLGGIGLLVAERLAAFGMKVNAVTEIKMPLLSTVQNVYLGDQLMEALPAADAVIMGAPLTPRTKNMLSTQQFRVMKDEAYLINVSRGGTIDLDALKDELDAGRFAGIGLDVTNPEPLPLAHPIRNYDRVMITPHLAGRSDNLRERNFDLITTNIRRFINGLPLVNVVDKAAGF